MDQKVAANVFCRIPSWMIVRYWPDCEVAQHPILVRNTLNLYGSMP